MISSAQPRPKQISARAFHAAFVAMLPDIRRHAMAAFRHLDREAQAEAVQEVSANAFVAFHRLAELDKLDLAYPAVLAKYGVAQCRDGRKVGGRLNVNDALSPYAQRNKGFQVERLDKLNRTEDAWQRVVVEDRHAGPAEVAITRLDFAQWLGRLPLRLRRIARFLAAGETTTDAAEHFNISPGRVSQIRRELKHNWESFQSQALGNTATA